MTYIEKLTKAVQDMHGCKAKHVRGVPLTESFRGRVVWSGIVEVFSLEGHPKARTCYAWSAMDGTKESFTAVLELPPVDSPQKAVQVAIVSAAKESV